MRQTSLLPLFGTQTSPYSSRSGYGCLPTVSVRTTAFAAGSTIEIVPSAVFGIQTRPSGVITPLVGNCPTFTCATTAFVAVSMREIVPLPRLTLQSCVPSVARPSGAVPFTATRLAVLVTGSIRNTNVSLVPFDPIHNCFPTTAKFAGAPPVLIVLTTLFVRGLIRETVPSKLFDAQTEPNANATSQTFGPTLMRLTTLSLTGSTRSIRPVPNPSIQVEPALFATHT